MSKAILIDLSSLSFPATSSSSTDIIKTGWHVRNSDLYNARLCRTTSEHEWLCSTGVSTTWHICKPLRGQFDRVGSSRVSR